MQITDHESERRILSAMLHSENACAEAIDRLLEGDFSIPLHQTIFNLIASIYAKSVRPTLVEVIKEGHSNGIFAAEEIDDLSYIAQQYIDDENIGYWIDKVKIKTKVRAMDEILRKYRAMLDEAPDSQAEDILINANDDFSSLLLDDSTEEIDEPEEIAKIGYEEVERRMERYRKHKAENPYAPPPLDGVPTGIPTLDAITLGFKPGDLIILGAKTGDGKTSFALNISNSVAVATSVAAVGAKQPVLYINTEMSKQQIALRWGSILSGVEHDKIRNGAITNEELSIIFNAYGELSNSKFYPAYIPNLTPIKLQNLARKAKIRKDVKLIILDYVGRMDTKDARMQEWQVLYDIVKTQKQLAQNLQVACLVLIQLNNDDSIQGAKRMKNESDLMLKLSPVTPAQAKEIEDQKGYMYENFNYQLFIDKNRDGAAGNAIPIFFDKRTQQIKQAVKMGKEVKTDA